MKNTKELKMSTKLLLSLSAFLFLLSACGTPTYNNENSALIVFKTPTFKYADMGFVYENASEVKAEIYGSGQAIMSLSVQKSSVCMSLFACMSKKKFNAQVLSAQYPEDILDNIFRAKAIFNGKNIRKSSNGFTQILINPGKYNIHYSVLNNQTVFRDTINNILIKVKKQ